MPFNKLRKYLHEQYPESFTGQSAPKIDYPVANFLQKAALLPYKPITAEEATDPGIQAIYGGNLDPMSQIDAPLSAMSKIVALKKLESLYGKAHPKAFTKAVEESTKLNPKIAENLSKYTPEELTKMQLYLSPDKLSGYALKDTDELVNVFSGTKGRGNEIVQNAIDKGAKRLDHFEGYLSDLYKKHGFEEVKREPNWTPGNPDVVYRKLKK